MPLDAILRQIIAAKGPISVAAFMELALQHPDFGYYRRHDPLGATGDFITAPEISQLFGEMIGLWCADLWRQMQRPPEFTWLELGPGRGTLMQDALRATAKIKGFHDALRLHLMESNDALRKLQAEKLAHYRPVYIAGLDELPPQPLIGIANEFFDALPIRQFKKSADGWRERLVGLGGRGLALTLSPPAAEIAMLLTESIRAAPDGFVYEVSLPALAITRELSKHIARHGGGALIVDYGYAEPSGHSSLQAVSDHAPVDIFDRPGAVDLTAHIDFGALRRIATGQSLHTAGPVGQGAFLQDMGIALRAAQLRRSGSPEQAAAIDAGLARLTAAAQMGQLFKALAIVAPNLQPAGFP